MPPDPPSNCTSRLTRTSPRKILATRLRCLYIMPLPKILASRLAASLGTLLMASGCLFFLTTVYYLSSMQFKIASLFSISEKRLRLPKLKVLKYFEDFGPKPFVNITVSVGCTFVIFYSHKPTGSRNTLLL